MNYYYINFNIILSTLFDDSFRDGEKIEDSIDLCCSGISSHLTDLLIFSQLFIAAVHARDVMRPRELLRALQVTRGHSNHLLFVE